MKKHVLSILMIMILAFAMFSATAVVTYAEGEDDYAAVGAEVTEITDAGDDYIVADDGDATEAEIATEAETEVATEAETEAETTAETVAPTTAETTAPTTAPTQAATIAAKNANTPKTGDNIWLFVGIGVIVVAVIAIIISVAAKKKNQ